MENLTNTVATVNKLEGDLNTAILMQDWLGAAASASEIARTGDDWNRTEIYLGLSQTYASMAQASEARVSNQLATESSQREASMQYKQDELIAAVSAMATAVREIASR